MASTLEDEPAAVAQGDGNCVVPFVSPDSASHFWRLLRDATAARGRAPHQPRRTQDADHCRAFLRWLCLTVEQQVADLESLLAQQSEETQQAVIRWIETGQHLVLIPGRALPHERELFLNDLEIVITLQSAERTPG